MGGTEERGFAATAEKGKWTAAKEHKERREEPVLRPKGSRGGAEFFFVGDEVTRLTIFLFPADGTPEFNHGWARMAADGFFS
jgi:hypothetical protein